MIWKLLEFGWLGYIGLISSIGGLILAILAEPSISKNPQRIVHKRGEIFAGKVMIGIILALLSTMPTSPKGLASIVLPLQKFLKLLGPGYFILASMIIDSATYIILHSKERCLEDGAIAWNIVHMPFISLAASLVAFLSRNWRRKEVKGIVLGYSVMVVRRVVGGLSWTNRESDTRVFGEKWEVKSLPRSWRQPYVYDPELFSNPHIGIFGATRQGKTSHCLYLIGSLAKRLGYPVMVFDMKGDFSRGAVSRGWIEKGLAEVIDVAELGIDPLRIGENGDRDLAIVRLIEAMSVVEELGSNQKAVLIRASVDLEPFTYETFQKRVEERLKEAMAGKEGGPHIRDAYTGLYNRIKLSAKVFRDGGKITEESITLDGWKGIKILDLSGIPDDRLRALAAEWILRVIYDKGRRRGPTAFLEKRKVFLVIDEVHEIARAQRWRRDMTSSILEDLARKAGSYGIVLITITQRLSDVAAGLRSNVSGLWIIFRDADRSDIKILQTVTSCGLIGGVVSNLKQGQALIIKACPEFLENFRLAYGKPVAAELARVVEMIRLKIGGSPSNDKQAMMKLKEPNAHSALDERGAKAGHRQIYSKVYEVSAKMRKCPRCGAEPVFNDQIFCHRCGTRMRNDLVAEVRLAAMKFASKGHKRLIASVSDRAIQILINAAKAGGKKKVLKILNSNYKDLMVKEGIMTQAGAFTVEGRILFKSCKEVMNRFRGGEDGLRGH